MVYPQAVRTNWIARPTWWRTNRDLAYLDYLIDLCGAAYHFGPRDTFLAGLSDGADMAALYAAERSQRIAGAIVYAGGLLKRGPLDLPGRPAMLFVRGERDHLVRDPKVADARERLFAAGCPVAELAAPGGHRWDPAMNPAIAGWVRTVHASLAVEPAAARCARVGHGVGGPPGALDSGLDAWRARQQARALAEGAEFSRRARGDGFRLPRQGG